MEASKRLQSDLDLLQNLPFVEEVDMIYIRYLEQLVKTVSHPRDLDVMLMMCERVLVDEPSYILLGLFFFEQLCDVWCVMCDNWKKCGCVECVECV